MSVFVYSDAFWTHTILANTHRTNTPMQSCLCCYCSTGEGHRQMESDWRSLSLNTYQYQSPGAPNESNRLLPRHNAPAFAALGRKVSPRDGLIGINSNQFQIPPPLLFFASSSTALFKASTTGLERFFFFFCQTLKIWWDYGSCASLGWSIHGYNRLRETLW